jgi:hypothetical protein
MTNIQSRTATPFSGSTVRLFGFSTDNAEIDWPISKHERKSFGRSAARV